MGRGGGGVPSAHAKIANNFAIYFVKTELVLYTGIFLSHFFNLIFLMFTKSKQGNFNIYQLVMTYELNL